MNRFLIAITLVSTVALAGCQSATEMAAEDDAVCQGYGLEKGTPAYIQCREFQQNDRTARYEAYQQRQAIWSIANAISNAGNKGYTGYTLGYTGL